MHATTMKTKRHYTAPVTQRATVELEGGFCGSISEQQTVSVKSMTQDYEEIDASSGFGGTKTGTGENEEFSITWK